MIPLRLHSIHAEYVISAWHHSLHLQENYELLCQEWLAVEAIVDEADREHTQMGG